MDHFRFLFALGLTMIFTSGYAQAETVWITQKSTKCKAVQPVEQQHGVDFILRKCTAKDFPPLWLAFIDSARSSIGLGELPNLASAGGNLKQTNGPIDWGGKMREGKFKPQVAIIRKSYDDFSFDPPKKLQTLAIFRMLNNGSSCLVATLGPTKDQNMKARLVAEMKIADFTCETSPELIPIKG